MTIQKTIIEGISELLYNNEFVVVPGFGGFVSRTERSHYSLNRSVIHPPSKKILFNVQLKQNDGILASWLKDKINCDFIQAGKHIEEFASYSKMLLDTKRRLEFETLGLFYLDLENNICFEPKTDINFLIDSFGLSSITLKELPVEAEQKVIETVDRVEKAEQKLPVKKRNYKRFAALAIGIPVLTTALLLAVNQLQPNSQFFSNMFGKGNHNVYTPVTYSGNLKEISLTNVEPYVVDANGYASIDLFGTRSTVVNVSALYAVNTTSHSSKSNMSFGGRFQVVLGCFGVKSNASRLVKSLAKENIVAGISGVNAKGLHVVSCGGFNDKESATILLQNLKSKFPTAWIMAQ